MAGSTAVSKTTFHSRSSSFPSKSHPLTTSVEDQLHRLRGSEAASTSASTILNNLDSLQDLHQRVTELIQLPSFQKALSHKRSASDEILEGSLRLLDFCSIVREALLSAKESIQVLQSSLRRKTTGTLLDEGSDLVAIVNMVIQVQDISFSVLKSVLSHVSEMKATEKQSGWSKLSKFMQPKRVLSGIKETEGHEVKKIDEALNALTVHKSCKDINTFAAKNKQAGVEDFSGRVKIPAGDDVDNFRG